MEKFERTPSSLVVSSTLVLIVLWVVALVGCGAGRQQSPPLPTQSGFVFTANGGSNDVSAL
jgi:hypothetical protein